jgi:hypothetical protein
MGWVEKKRKEKKRERLHTSVISPTESKETPVLLSSLVSLSVFILVSKDKKKNRKLLGGKKISVSPPNVNFHKFYE